ALRAQVALRPHVVAISADQLDVFVLHVDLQPAHALAQRTRDEMSLHQSSCSRPPCAGPPDRPAAEARSRPPPRLPKTSTYERSFSAIPIVERPRHRSGGASGSSASRPSTLPMQERSP